MANIKKIIASICFLSAGASSLFAMEKNSLILYPEAGLGFSSGFSAAFDPEGASRFLGSNTTLFKSPEVKTGVSWSLGCGADYALTGLTAVTSGLFIDKTPYKIVYKKTASERNDLEINTDFVYLTIPAGLRLYVDLFMLGGGLYMGYTLSCKSSLKYGNSTTSVNLENPAAMGLFIKCKS